jgi:hypothetical protein
MILENLGMVIDVDHRAGPLKESDLKYQYSESRPVPHSLQSDAPDPSCLNRRNIYEVLYFVNRFAILYGKGSTGVARQAEKLLHEQVPPELHSHEKIMQWLLDYWKFHS